MDIALLTLLYLLFALAVAAWCGYGLVTMLMPDEYRQYQVLVMPTTGYLAFSLLTIIISGNFNISVTIAVWVALASLSLLSAVALYRARKLNASVSVARGLAVAAALLVPVLLVVLWPLLYQGAELYLGSVNLDFFQSLIYQDILRKNDLSVFGSYAQPTEGASIDWAAHVWPATNQARFGGVMFSYLLQSLTPMSAKASLTITIATFALCVPASVFFFSRVVLGFTERTSVLSGLLIGISAPVALGFMFTLVGQGSAMPVLPLVIALLYVSVTKPSIRVHLYAAITVLGLVSLYAAMLPFAVAPITLLALLLLLRRQLSLLDVMKLFAITVIAGALVWGGMLSDLAGFVMGLASVSTSLAGTVFFVDFLTEMFFVYLFGIASYTLPNSVFNGLINAHVPGGNAWQYSLAAASFLALFVVASWAIWWRQQVTSARRMAVASLCLVYACVWGYFTFVRPYGYSVFKMAMWYQFIILPLIAHGLVWLWDVASNHPIRFVARSVAALVAIFFGATNLVAAIDYGHLSFGDNRNRGFIVNTFGHGGNPDLAAVGAGIAPLVSKEQTVGLTFTDTLQNHWAAYRLMGVAKQLVVSHEQLDADDAYLPDPQTGVTADSAGKRVQVDPLSYADIKADFYLLPGSRNLNPEIVDQTLPKPVWSNGTYELHAASAMQDYVFLGRGFYRSGFPALEQQWWQPGGPSRWTQNGGEFYLMKPSQPGTPHRLAFDAMVGYGNPSASRTLQFWYDGKIFDEIIINDTARVVSAPFFPSGDLNRVTVVVRETTKPLPRRDGLWFKEVSDDPRLLNVRVSSVRLLKEAGPMPARIASGKVSGKQILDVAHQFNGLSVDGWLQKQASLSMVAPFENPRTRMELMIPGNLEYSFPYRVQVSVNGVEQVFTASAPGPFVIDLALQKAKANELVKFQIKPEQSRVISNPFNDKYRSITQSVHLESLQFFK